MSRELETVESLLRDIRDEMRTANERSEKSLTMWAEQREANRVIEERHTVEHAATMEFHQRAKERDEDLRRIDRLNIEQLERNAAREARWAGADSVIGRLTEASTALASAIEGNKTP